MSAEAYYDQIDKVLGKIHHSQREKLEKAGELFGHAIAAGKRATCSEAATRCFP